MVHRYPVRTKEEEKVSACTDLVSARIGRALLCLLLFGSVLRAESREADITVACPASWAITQRSVALAQTRFWLSPTVPFGPDDRIVPLQYAASVLLDCAYGSARDPEVRLTMQVPGLAQSCGEPLGPHRPTCQTVVSSADDRPQIHVAERVGPKTSLNGFTLGQDAATLAEMAGAAGFRCEQTEGLTCLRGNTRIEVWFARGRSRQVVTSHLGNLDAIAASRAATYFRFGLKRSFSGPDASTESWVDRRSGVSVAMPMRDGAFVLVLEGRAPR